MERSRLKNIIILILVLVNVFLLASLLSRKSAETTSRALAAEQLAALFAADSISLDTDIITYHTPPASKDLTRSVEREREAAAYFLGDPLLYADQGGSIYTYTGNRGAAMFRSTGSFDIVGTLSSSDDAEDLCRDFCKEFSYSEPQFQLDETGSGSAVAFCQFGDLSVFNATVTFTFQKGVLTSVSGTLLPLSGNPISSKMELLSASAALTTFHQFLRESGAAVSAVSDLTLCYELQSTPTSAMSLVPCWCITTNTMQYYVNCSTGTVSAD